MLLMPEYAAIPPTGMLPPQCGRVERRRAGHGASVVVPSYTPSPSMSSPVPGITSPTLLPAGIRPSGLIRGGVVLDREDAVAFEHVVVGRAEDPVADRCACAGCCRRPESSADTFSELPIHEPT